MAKAVWNGQTLAESENFQTVEGNIYFPDESVKREFFRVSSTTSTCPWKGLARYYTLVVDGQENPLVVAETSKFYEVQKFCSQTNHVWDGSWIVTSNRTWRGVPDDIKAKVARGFNEGAIRQRDAVTKLNDNLASSLQQKGITFNDTDPAPFREVLKKAGFYAEWKAKYGEEAWALLEKAAGRLG